MASCIKTSCGDRLVVGSIVWDEEAQIGIVQHGSNSDQARPPTRYDGDILPGVLALLSLAMFMVVQVGDGFPQRLDTGSGSILSSCHGDIDSLWAMEAAFDVIVDFGGSLAQIGPLVGTIAKAVLVGTLCTPDNTGGGTGGIQTSMGTMAFVGVAELAVDFGALFTVRKR